ncbi:MAG TPA: TolC family protein [Flavipsychrobacter sp.]|nr:TolC family protein [Flavipsychrobacter sp.]
MRRQFRRLLILIASLPFALHAQEAQRMSLEDCLRYAAQNQIKIKNALLDQQSTLAKNREVTGMAYPQINAKGGINYAPLVAAFEIPDFISGAIKGAVQSQYLNDTFRNAPIGTLPLAFQPKWTTTGTLEASQILFDPSVLVALQARKTLEELAAKSVDITIQDVKVAVTKAYYNVLIAEKQQGLVEQNLTRLQQMEHEMNEYYKAGFREKIDVDRITVALNNLKTQQIRIDQAIGLARLSLKYQMGMPLQTPIALADSLSDNSLNSDLLVDELDFNDRNEFELLQIQNRLYSYDVKRYRLGWIPTLSFFGNYGYTLYNQAKLFEPGGNWQKSALLGVSLNVPIFDGFQRRNRLKQAEITLQKNENDIENLKMGLGLEEQTAKISLRNNLLTLANQRSNMELAEEVYNTARIKYNEGVGSSLEVMDAESALREAQTNYFTALYDAMTARVDLQKALGQF